MKTNYALFTILLAAGVANGQSNQKNITNMELRTTVTQENKEIIFKLYESVLNARNLESLSDFVAENYIGPSGKKGTEGFKEGIEVLIAAFPDVKWKIESLIAEDNKIVVKWRITGTHLGSFHNIKATHKKVSNEGIGLYELEDGKIISSQIMTDRAGFFQQLGALPVDLTQLSTSNESRDYVRFIDKFIVPENAKQEFMERVRINRNFIKKLPGFIEDAAYERTNDEGNVVFITVAVWENETALQNAKEAVQATYKKEGFNPAEMLERLNITIDRGTYTEVMN